MLKTRTGDFQAEQSAYLLEYDRRRILNCADTFRSLAAVLTGMNLEEEDGEEGSREQRLQKRRAQEDRKNKEKETGTIERTGRQPARSSFLVQ